MEGEKMGPGAQMIQMFLILMRRFPKFTWTQLGKEI